MPTHTEKRVVPYSAEQMCALVADVESYPAFLPWCHAARVLERREGGMVAELEVGYKALRERFVSDVSVEAGRSIVVRYAGGPLRHLSNRWVFEPVAGRGSEVTFFLDFDFRSRLFSVLMDGFFDFGFKKMAEAFEQRAESLYGKG